MNLSKKTQVFTCLMRRALLLKSFSNDLLFLTVKFAVDLGSGLALERTAVACL